MGHPFSICSMCSAVESHSLWPHGLPSARFLSPWDFPGKNTGVGCHFFQGVVFLPGKFHGQRSLEGHSPWHRQELVTTGHTSMHGNIKVMMEH